MTSMTSGFPYQRYWTLRHLWALRTLRPWQVPTLAARPGAMDWRHPWSCRPWWELSEVPDNWEKSWTTVAGWLSNQIQPTKNVLPLKASEFENLEMLTRELVFFDGINFKLRQEHETGHCITTSNGSAFCYFLAARGHRIQCETQAAKHTLVRSKPSSHLRFLNVGSRWLEITDIWYLDLKIVVIFGQSSKDFQLLSPRKVRAT